MVCGPWEAEGFSWQGSRHLRTSACFSAELSTRPIRPLVKLDCRRPSYLPQTCVQTALFVGCKMRLSPCSRLHALTPSDAAFTSHAALTIPLGFARAPPRASGCSEQLRPLFFKAACVRKARVCKRRSERCEPICFNRTTRIYLRFTRTIFITSISFDCHKAFDHSSERRFDGMSAYQMRQ